MNGMPRLLSGLTFTTLTILGAVAAFFLLQISSGTPITVHADPLSNGDATLSDTVVNSTGVDYVVRFNTGTELTASVTGSFTEFVRFQLSFGGGADLSSVTTAATGAGTTGITLGGLGSLTRKADQGSINGDNQYYVEVTSPASGAHSATLFLHRNAAIPADTTVDLTIVDVANGPSAGTFDIAATTKDQADITVDGPTDIPYTLVDSASGGQVGGTFSVGGGPPLITAVSSPGLMVPQQTSTLTISVDDADTLANISSIKVALLFDPGDADPSDVTIGATGSNVSTKAIFRWTNASPFSSSSFELEGPIGSTWNVEGTTNPGDGTGTSGDFVLKFKPGEIAAFGIGGVGNDGWDMLVEVTDNTGSDIASSNTGVGTSTLADRFMGDFASVSVSPASISFGPRLPNSSGNPIATPSSGFFTTTSISNKTHALSIEASTPWEGGPQPVDLDTDGSPGAAAISIRADDDGTLSGAQFVTASAVDLAGHSTDARDTVEAGTDTDISLWLDLGAVAAGVYTGSITTTVVN